MNLRTIPSMNLTPLRSTSRRKQGFPASYSLHFLSALLCMVLLVSRLALGQCCGDGGGRSGGISGSTAPEKCPEVAVCYYWDLGTGIYQAAGGSLTVEITVGLPPGVQGPPNPPIVLPAGQHGSGSLFAKPGVTITAAFVPALQAGEGHVYFQECETCSSVGPVPDSFTVPACLDGGNAGEGNSDLDSNDGGGRTGGNGDGDDNPYRFTLGLGYLPDGEPAGRLDFRPVNIDASSVSALALNVSLASSVANTLDPLSQVGTLSAPDVIVTIAEIINNNVRMGFTLTCVKPGQTTPFVTWRFLRTATLAPQKMLVEKVVDGIVVTSEQLTKQATGWDLDTGSRPGSGAWAKRIEHRKTTIAGTAPSGDTTHYSRKLYSLFDFSPAVPVPQTTLVMDESWVKNQSGNVVSRTVGSLTTNYVYDGAGQVTLETRSDGSWRKRSVINLEMKDWDVLQTPTNDLLASAASTLPNEANSGRVVLSHRTADGTKSYQRVYEDGQLIRTSETVPATVDYGGGTVSIEGGGSVALQATSTTTWTAGSTTISTRCMNPDNAAGPGKGRAFYTSETRGSKKTRRVHSYELRDPSGNIDASVRKESTVEMENSFSGGQYTGEPIVQQNRSREQVRFIRISTNQILAEQDRLIGDNSVSILLSSTTYEYDDGGHQTRITRNGVETYSAEWVAGRMVAEVDEHGTLTEYGNFDAENRPRTVTKTGFAGAGADAPAQAASVTQYTYDTLGRKLSETLVATPPIIRTWTYDLNGRVTSQMESAIVANWPYLATTGKTYTFGVGTGGGKQITATSNAGLSVVKDYFRDGSLKSTTGNGAIAETYTYGWLNHVLGQLKKTTITRGIGAEAVQQSRYTDGAGHVRLTEEPNPLPNIPDALLTRQYDYAAEGGLRLGMINGALALVRSQFSADRFAVNLNLESTTNAIAEGYEESGIEFVAGHYYTFQRTERGGSRRQLSGLDAVIAGKGTLESHSQQLGESGTVISESFTYADRTNKLVRTETFRAGASSPQVRLVRNGRLESDRQSGYSVPRVYAYDSIGRQISVKDSATGKTTTFGYSSISFTNNSSVPFKPAYVVETDATGAVVNTQYKTYDARGNLVLSSPSTIIEDYAIWYSYNDRGQIVSQKGLRTYPIRYSYNSLGLIRTMTTYFGPKQDGNWLSSADYTLLISPDSSGGPAVTEWIYYPGTTKLASKKDADLKSVAYTYDQFGRLATRLSPRTPDNVPLVATYHYDLLGQLVSVTYSDGTPGATFSLPDTRGRYTKIEDGAGQRTFVRAAQGDGEQVTETLSPTGADGFAAMVMTTVRDAAGRITDIDASADTAGLLDEIVAYNPADGRLLGVGDSLTGVAAMYGRSANSEFVNETVTFSGTLAAAIGGTATERQRFTRSRDNEGRLAGAVTTRPGAITLDSHAFGYDGLDRRTSDTRQDGVKWDFGYNTRNEVTSASRKAADGAALNGWQFSYWFDAIGNRYFSSGPQRSGNYSINKLNQYTSGTVDGKVEVVGEVTTPNTTVWARRLAPPPVEGQLQASVEATMQGAWFHRWMPVDNQAAPAVAEVAVTGVRAGSSDFILNESGRTLVPSATEVFDYDTEGNMKSDSLWTYKWDGENRLSEVVSKLPVSGGNHRKVKFTYDYANRIVKKEVLLRDPAMTVWTSEYRRYFVWQGWNIIAELENRPVLVGTPAVLTYPATATLLRRNVWGLDLSGSLQRAGGVGGLLAVQNLPSAAVTTPVYDGNGNILAYHDLTSGAKVADFAYGPFGEPLKAYGEAAKKHPFRFSTKYTDEETGLVLYQLRPYRADLGRWLQRDRIGEIGGKNLYGMLSNNPVANRDVLGLANEDEKIELLLLIIQGQKDYAEKCPLIKAYLDCLAKNIIKDGDLQSIIDRISEVGEKIGDVDEALTIGSNEWLHAVLTAVVQDPAKIAKLEASQEFLANISEALGYVGTAIDTLEVGEDLYDGNILAGLLKAGGMIAPLGVEDVFGFYSGVYDAAHTALDQLFYKGSKYFIIKAALAAGVCGGCRDVGAMLGTGLNDPWGCNLTLQKAMQK